MSVGIMDADIAKYQAVPFNLEVMKLSAYYKKENQVVILTPQFYPERHTQFIYRKDYEDGDYPPNLLSLPNVSYGGLAFSNNKYVPLEPDIEGRRPDMLIYEKLFQFTNGNKSLEKIYQTMLNSEHCRISLDGETVWPQFYKQFINLKAARHIMFHDYDLGAIQGGFETVQKILSKARTDGWATRVGMKFPVNMYTGQDLLNWSSLHCDGIFYFSRYNGVIEHDAFIDWVSHPKERAIFTQMEYNVTSSSYEENDFIERLILEIFHQVIISRSYRVFFTLTYNKEFFTDQRWCEVLDLFNFFHNSYRDKSTAAYLTKIQDDTLFDFAAHCSDQPDQKYKGKSFSREKIREIFRFVQETNYDLFQDFYTCTAKSLGG